MALRRFLLRLLIGLVSTVVVLLLLLAGAGALALHTDWQLPRERELGAPSALYDRAGDGWFRFIADVEHYEVGLDQISQHLQDAVVATEDHRFHEHVGVDPLGVVRAVYQNVRASEIREGASTLTQQYVKLTFTGAERTLSRKIREAVLAIQLEKDLSKDQILEAYLNRAYFGEGAYGAQAAAIRYFDVPASQLTLAQAATIASTLSRPSDHSPLNDPEGTLARRNVVLQEMATYGLRTQEEVDQATAQPLGLRPFTNPAPYAPYLVEEIRRQLLESYGHDLLYRGGLQITATVDLDEQYVLETQMIPHLPADPGFEPAAVALDPRTGDIRAAWSGRDFGASQVDVALSQDYGRPSGSTFKVFALAAALEEGYVLDSVWTAPSTITIGDWTPRGGGCGGRCTLLQATAGSINTVYAQVAEAVGTRSMTRMAARLGVRSTMRDDDLTQVLGTASVTPLDMAGAFGTLANDGVACPARLILSVTDADGAALAPPDPRRPDDEQVQESARLISDEGWVVDDEEEDLGRCHRAVAAGVARRANIALQAVVSGGTGTRADIGRPQAGKTGTTTASTQVWFAGHTPDLSLAVMVSHRDGDVPLRDLPGCGASCYGGQLPAEIWADIAGAMLADVPPSPFPLPEEGDRRESRQPAPPRRPAPATGAVTRPPPPPPVGPTTPQDAPAPTAPVSDPVDQDETTPEPEDDPPGPDGGILGDLLGGEDDDPPDPPEQQDAPMPERARPPPSPPPPAPRAGRAAPATPRR